MMIKTTNLTRNISLRYRIKGGNTDGAENSCVYERERHCRLCGGGPGNWGDALSDTADATGPKRCPQMYFVKGEFNHHPNTRGSGSFVAKWRLWEGGYIPCPVYGPDKNKTDGQSGAFQIPGALPFSFKAVDAAWTIRRLYPLQNAGL